MNIDIGQLIEKIGPFNNRIRDCEGYKRISLMWEVGDILFEGGVKKVHPVAWEIHRRSYITRDLLSYCYRVRKKWPNKQELQRLFHKVVSYGVFREALPLIENEKFILGKKEVNSIIESLSMDDPLALRKHLASLKKKHINIRNDRRQRLHEIREEVVVFNEFYQYLSGLIKEGDSAELASIKRKLGEDGMLRISQFCMAISKDDYKGPTNIDTINLSGILVKFVEKLLPLSLAAKEKKARFRRLIPSDSLVEIADIINSVRLGESASNIKKRLGFGAGGGKKQS